MKGLIKILGIGLIAAASLVIPPRTYASPVHYAYFNKAITSKINLEAEKDLTGKQLYPQIYLASKFSSTLTSEIRTIMLPEEKDDEELYQAMEKNDLIVPKKQGLNKYLLK